MAYRLLGVIVPIGLLVGHLRLLWLMLGAVRSPYFVVSAWPKVRVLGRNARKYLGPSTVHRVEKKKGQEYRKVPNVGIVP